MSIILLLIGIVSVGGITTFNINSEQRQYKNTQDKIKKIQGALLTFLAQNGRLPCPASPTQAQATTTFGTESITFVSQQPAYCNTSGTGILSADLSSGAGIDALYYGMVPVRTLGLADDDAADAFGNKIGYVVQRAFTNSIATNDKCTPGHKSKDINNNVRYMCYCGQASGSVDPATPDLTIIPDYGSTNYSSLDAVYVLISHGSNGYGAFYKDAGGTGAAVRNPYPPATNQGEMQNLDCNPSTGVCGSPININYVSRPRNKNFDDIVVYANRNSMFFDCNAYAADTCTNTFNIYTQ